MYSHIFHTITSLRMKTYQQIYFLIRFFYQAILPVWISIFLCLMIYQKLYIRTLNLLYLNRLVDLIVNPLEGQWIYVKPSIDKPIDKKINMMEIRKTIVRRNSENK